MSSISSAGSSLPLQLLQQQLTKNVSSAKVNSSDQDALSSALNDIDTALQATDRPASGTPEKPSKATLDSLIAKEVASGKLTSDQATELQGVFGSFAGADGNASSGTGFSVSDLISGATSANGVSDGTSSDTSNTLNDFLKLLQKSSVSGYSAAGVTSGSLAALLVDIKS